MNFDHGVDDVLILDKELSVLRHGRKVVEGHVASLRRNQRESGIPVL